MSNEATKAPACPNLQTHRYPSQEEIESALTARFEDLARTLLGEPDGKLSRGMQWRYRAKGSLSLEMSGDKRGSWYDHEAGEGGGPLKLIERERCTDWRGALDVAREWLDRASINPVAAPGRQKAARTATNQADARRLAKARRIASATRPVSRTGGADYLVDRGITVAMPASVGFVDDGAFIEGDATGALVVLATDDAGELRAVQRVFVRDGRKATVEGLAGAKRSNGLQEGAAVRLPGPADRPLVLAEGPETGLSCWQASGLETWVALGSVAKLTPPADRVVIVARDGDAADSPADRKICKRLAEWHGAGLAVRVAWPGQGRDFNDVLQAEGDAGVRRRIEGAVPYQPPEPPTHPPHFDPPADRETGLARQRKAICAWMAAATMRARYERHWRRQAKTGHDAQPFATPAEKGRITRQAKRDALAALGLDATPAVPRELVSGSQGTGKTRQVLRLLTETGDPELVAWVLEPTHEKAEEVAADLRSLTAELGADVAVWVMRGRGAVDPETGEAMCKRAPLAERVARAGLSVQDTLCDDGSRRCPHFDACAYQRQRVAMKEAGGGVFVGSHEYAFLRPPAPPPDLVVIDEEVTAKAGTSLSFGLDRLELVGDYGAAGEDDPERAADYRDTALKVRGALMAPGAELQALRDGGVTVADLKEAESYLLDAAEKLTHDISPELDDDDIAARLAAVEASELRKVRRLYGVLAEEMATGRKGALCARLDQHARIEANGAGERQARVTVWFVRKPERIAADTPLLLLDGTGNPWFARRLWGDGLAHTHCPVERNAEVIQVLGKGWSRQSITGCDRHGNPLDHRGKTSAALRREIAEFANGLPGPVFLAATKGAEEALAPELRPHVRTGHFGALRGINRFEDCETAVVIGREQPSVGALEDALRPWLASDPEPLLSVGQYVRQSRAIRMRDGSVRWTEVEVHPDPRAQAMLEQIREAEIAQAVDRIRVIHNEQPKAIYLLSPVVCDLTVDRVRNWRELREGGGRLARVFAVAGMLPLGAKDLHALAGGAFPSEEAARTALKRAGNNGVTSQIDIIIWGLTPFSATYRRAGQRGKSSRILVDPRRYATAEDARDELAHLLGADVEWLRFDQVDTVPVATPPIPPPKPETRSAEAAQAARRPEPFGPVPQAEALRAVLDQPAERIASPQWAAIILQRKIRASSPTWEPTMGLNPWRLHRFGLVGLLGFPVTMPEGFDLAAVMPDPLAPRMARAGDGFGFGALAYIGRATRLRGRLAEHLSAAGPSDVGPD